MASDNDLQDAAAAPPATAAAPLAAAFSRETIVSAHSYMTESKASVASLEVDAEEAAPGALPARPGIR